MRDYYIITASSVDHVSIVLSMSMPQWIKCPPGGGRNPEDLMETHPNRPKLNDLKVPSAVTYGFTLLAHGKLSEGLTVYILIHIQSSCVI